MSWIVAFKVQNAAGQQRDRRGTLGSLFDLQVVSAMFQKPLQLQLHLKTDWQGVNVGR